MTIEKRKQPSPEAAEALAVQGLTYLASDPPRLRRFLAASGLDADQIRSAATDPGFLLGVIEHILADESLLRAFAAETGVDPAAVANARTVLGGPAWERDIP
jgi:hypothetical protein